MSIDCLAVQPVWTPGMIMT